MSRACRRRRSAAAMLIRVEANKMCREQLRPSQ